MVNKLNILFGCLLLVVLVASCGGGGSSDQSNYNPQTTGETLNPGLEGKFFFVYRGNAYTMNVEEGDYYKIPNTDWNAQKDRYPYAAVTTFGATVVEHDSTEFLVIGSESLQSYVCMQDYSGNYLGQFTLSGSVKGGRISQDHRFIAIFRQTGSISNTPWLEIYTRDGTLVDKKELNSRQLIWLRDNSILYSSGRTFYFTKPVSTEIQYSLTLPDPDNSVVSAGLIGDKSISPDQTQIAFTVAESGGSFIEGVVNSRLYVMSIDGTNIRLLATTYGDVDPRIITPSWSPDGRWIFVEERYEPGATRLGGEYGDMYIVPADDNGKMYYLSEDDAKRSQEVRQLRRYFTLPDEGSGITTEGTSSRYSWIPD